jgi:chromosome segregation ATPase
MKDAPLMNIPAGMWPLVSGAGIGAIAGYLYGALALKGDRMTRLEKTCIAFVGALCEKLEETQRHTAQLLKSLTETEKKLADETARADRAEGDLRNVRSEIERLEKSITEMEGKLADVRQDKRRKGRHAEAAKL